MDALELYVWLLNVVAKFYSSSYINLITAYIMVLTIYLLVMEKMKLPFLFLWFTVISSFAFLISIGMCFSSVLFIVCTTFSFLKKGYVGSKALSSLKK